MSKKNVFRLMITVFLAVFVIVSGSALCQAVPDKITLKAVSAWPKTVFEVQNFMKFLDMVKTNVAKKYPGELEIDYKGGPEVMPNREQVEALRNGVFDMVFTTVGYYVSIIPEADGLNLTTLRPWEERSKGVNDFLNKIHNEKANAYYLGRMGTGIPFTLYLTKPIKTADLTGLKIRCSPTHINFLKKLGAKPIAIPPPDVYTALERKVGDGFTWPAGLIRDWGWQEVTKYIVEPSFHIATNVILVNLDAWNKLPRRLQDLLIATEEQAEHYAVERGRGHVQKEFAAFKKQGIKIIKLPAPEARKLTDAAYSSLWGTIIKKSPKNGRKLMEMLSR